MLNQLHIVFSKTIIAVFLSLLPMHKTPAQTTVLDSLDKILTTNPDKSTRAEIYETYADYYDTIHIEKSIFYRKKSLALYVELNDIEQQFTKLSNIAYTYQNTGLYDTALMYFHEAHALIPSIKQTSISVSTSINNLANLHFVIEEYDKSIQYYNESIRVAKKYNDPDGLIKGLIGLGRVYRVFENYDTLHILYDRAIREAKHYKIDKQLAVAYNNKATALTFENKIDDAIIYFDSSITIFDKLSDKHNSALMRAQKGYIYETVDHNYNRAIQLYENAAEMIKSSTFYISHKAEANRTLMHIYLQLSRAYSKKEDYQKALEYRIEYTSIMKTIQNLEKDKEVMRLTAKYEADKREQQIQLLEERSLNQTAIHKAEMREQRSVRYLIIGASVLIVLLSILFFYFRNRAQKKLLSKEAKIQSQNAEIQGQTTERRRIARDLHDGLGASLASLKLEFQAGMMDESKHLASDLILEQISNACEEVRNISHALLPKTLEDGSFHDTLTSMFEDFSSQIKIQYELYPEYKINLIPTSKQHHIYRCIQELLTNVVKHADADVIDVHVMVDDSGIGILVEDNGKGIDVDHASDGIGITNIKSRVKELSGIITFDSAENRGTSVSITIP